MQTVHLFESTKYRIRSNTTFLTFRKSYALYVKMKPSLSEHVGFFTTNMKPMLVALKLTAMPDLAETKCKSIARKLIITFKYLSLSYMLLRLCLVFYVISNRQLEKRNAINSLLATVSEILWTSSATLSYLWLTVKAKNITRVVSYLDEPFVAMKTPFYSKKSFVLGMVIFAFVTIQPVLIFNILYNTRSVTSVKQIVIVIDAVLFNIMTVYNLVMLTYFYFLSCLFLAFKISSLRDKMMSNNVPDTRFLVHLSESYTKACEVIKNFDYCFSPYLITSISSEMLFMCYGSTSIVKHIPSAVSDMVIVILLFNATFLLIMVILLSAHVGGAFQKGLTGVTQLATRVPVENTQFHQQAIILTQHLCSHSKIAHITVGGLFAIRKETLASAFLGILSYCVIITQMQNSEISPVGLETSAATIGNVTSKPLELIHAWAPGNL